jgi:lipoprotein-releasing system ATP-binding protein
MNAQATLGQASESIKLAMNSRAFNETPNGGVEKH